MRIYKLPSHRPEYLEPIPQKQICIYLNADGTTHSERLNLGPSPTELYGVRYKRMIPHRIRYLFLGQAFSLSGQTIYVFQEEPNTSNVRI